MEIYRNTVRFDMRLYLKSKKHIPKHRRLMLIEHLIDSIDADGIFPEELDGHDNFFEPTNEYEKKLWESCREMAKKDINDLKKSIQGGKKSAEMRKQKSAQAIPEPPKEKNVQELLEQTAENLSIDKAKDTIWIDDSFSVDKYPVFKIYVDEMPGSVIKSVEKWLKDKKKGEKVSLEFITQQFVNFAKRQNKPLFKKNT